MYRCHFSYSVGVIEINFEGVPFQKIKMVQVSGRHSIHATHYIAWAVCQWIT